MLGDEREKLTHGPPVWVYARYLRGVDRCRLESKRFRGWREASGQYSEQTYDQWVSSVSEVSQWNTQRSNLECVRGIYACDLMYPAAGTATQPPSIISLPRLTTPPSGLTSNNPIRKVGSQMPYSLPPIRMSHQHHLRIPGKCLAPPSLVRLQDIAKRRNRRPGFERAWTVPIKTLGTNGSFTEG